MKRVLIVALPMLLSSLLNPALGQAQQQNLHQKYEISQIAIRRETAPVAIMAAYDYAKAMAKPHAATQRASQSTCPSFLVSAPAILNLVNATNVYLYTGCGDIPIGTWIIIEEDYNDGTGGSIVYETTQDLSGGSLLEWFPSSALPVGGATFTITIVPPDLNTVRYQTTFDSPSPFQMAYEQVTVLPGGAIQRTVTVKGVYDGGLQALFFYTDITSRAVFIASDTVQFDVSDFSSEGGNFYPLTISQSGGANQQTVPVLHGSVGGKG
jgi:hypothetical protein